MTDKNTETTEAYESKLVFIWAPVLIFFVISLLFGLAVMMTEAVADDFTVSGGNPSSLPTVGDAAIDLPALTLTDADGDTFSDNSELIYVKVSTANYPAVIFDETVTVGSISVGGTCGHDSASSLTFDSATLVAVTVTGAGGGGNCGSGETITIDGLKIETIHEQSAPGASSVVQVDNWTTSPGGFRNAESINLSVTAADANASLALSTNSVVGGTGNTTLTLDIPIDLEADDFITIDYPANLNGSGVSTVSDTFGGAGSFNCSWGSLMTCTASDVIEAGTGTITYDSTRSLYASSSNTITDVTVYDDSAGENIAFDSSGAVTPDSTASDANASLTLGDNSVVGASGLTTLTFTYYESIFTTNSVIFTAPAFLDVENVAFDSTSPVKINTFDNCSSSGQTVTCTTGGSIGSDASLELIMTGIISLYEDTGQTITDVFVQRNLGNTQASDDSGTVTNTTPADADASITLGDNSVVNRAGLTTLNITIPVDLTATDTITFTMPDNLYVYNSSFDSESFDGTGTFTGCNASGQVITCTADGEVIAGTGTITMTGITSDEEAFGKTISSVAITDGETGNDIATDASGTVTNTTASASGSDSSDIIINEVRNISVTDYAEGSVKITWNDPTGNNTSHIDILRGVDPDPVNGAVYARVPIGTESYIDTDIETGQTVTYMLRATNLIATGDLSTEYSHVVGSELPEEEEEAETTDSGTTDETTEEEESTDETTDEVEVDERDFVDASFTDTSSHWAEDAVDFVGEAQIAKGNADGGFYPNSPFTRGNAIAMLYRVISEEDPQSPTEQIFPGVEIDEWYAGHLTALYERGFVSGHPDGTFRPSELMNRVEFLKIAMEIYLYLVDDETATEVQALIDGEAREPYSDIDNSAWYAGVVSAATELGFVQGSICGETYFCFNPGDAILRGEAAVILFNMFESILRDDVQISSQQFLILQDLVDYTNSYLRP